MKKETLVKDKNFETCIDMLDLQTDQVIIIGYTRSACADTGVDDFELFELQRRQIMQRLQHEFEDGFRVIWISEIGSGLCHFRDDSGEQYRPGLRLVANLIEAGVAKHMCVAHPSRIARDMRIYMDFVNLLVEHRATLIGVPTAKAIAFAHYCLKTMELLSEVYGSKIYAK